VIFTWVGFPAGLFSGSMLVTAVAALLGRPMAIPLPLARVSFVLIGILLGAVVTPETLRGVATWPLSIALLIMSALVMIVAASCYLRYVHGWEPLSALLGASPGSMAQVMALSAEFGTNIRGIAIVQTVRVLLVTIGLPGGLALFGLAAGGIPVGPSSANFSLIEFAVLAVASAATAVVVHRIRFPGGLLFGAMAAFALSEYRFRGNTLMGLAASAPSGPHNNYKITYYAPQPRAVIEVVDFDDATKVVGYGETGRVKLTTLTKEFFVPRFAERDEGERDPPSAKYAWDGVSGVKPFRAFAASTTVGVY